MTYHVAPYVLTLEANGYRRAWKYVILEGCNLIEQVLGFHTKEEAEKAAKLALRHWNRPEVE